MYGVRHGRTLIKALGSILNPRDGISTVRSTWRCGIDDHRRDRHHNTVNARDGICRGKPLSISYYYCRRYKVSGEVTPNPMTTWVRVIDLIVG